jgi:GxxExxY protein
VRLREIRADARIFLKSFVTEGGYVGNDTNAPSPTREFFTTGSTEEHGEGRMSPVGKDFDIFITNEDPRPSQIRQLAAGIDGFKEKSMPSPAFIQTPRVNQVSGMVVNAAMRVHSLLGPGLLESASQACLAQELRKRGLTVETQVGLPVVYEGEKLDLGYRIDLLVDNLVIVEIKCVETIHPVHEAQLLSYLRLSGKNIDC